MSQPNTAAIAVGAIFGGIALIFVSYKVYCKLWHCMHRAEQLPPISQPPTAYRGGVVVATLPTIAAPSYRRDGSSDHLASSISTSPQDGFVSTSTSEMPSPSIRPLDSVVLSTPGGYEPQFGGTSVMSSSSSTMTLKRSYLRSPSSHSFASSRRESYLPHSPRNRDSIQIVPPQPLGGMAEPRGLARDRSVDEFTSGLIWTETGDRRAVRANQRQQYLRSGPTRQSETASAVGSSQSSSGSAVMEAEELGAPEMQSLSAGNLARSAHLGSTAAIDPQLLRAEDSPLERLQSNAGQARPLPTRSSSQSNSNRSDSNASPILSPFGQDSPAASQPATEQAHSSSATQADEPK